MPIASGMSGAARPEAPAPMRARREKRESDMDAKPRAVVVAPGLASRVPRAGRGTRGPVRPA
ncbi:hypothetical protein Rmf_06870 [Roseomonas fluvialis]|uniref:Uncharacterized protein n=1 Tax=Roseomonas fluvialis TaxID=1750527 RepID=A0ABM7XZ21_9PROT|nr:hypothetical protein Rmf_06870 [Roseomonas fluvialis]